MKKILLIVTALLLTSLSFAQKTPCNLIEEQENGKTMYRGERNYVGTNYDDFRVCIQYLYDGENHCLELTLDYKQPLTVEEKSVAYIQFPNDEEVELKLSQIITNTKNGKIGCRYALDEKQKEIFAQKTITAIYFSTKEYSQIEIPELNKYTAKKLMERFNCGINTIGK
ncbi:MAG: hypothetical protein U0L57_00245 [Bacteroidales bacterium]|nr:hypothetical protein [Bacteroidales bacterium]